jgi:hypothetical protein
MTKSNFVAATTTFRYVISPNPANILPRLARSGCQHHGGTTQQRALSTKGKNYNC